MVNSTLLVFSVLSNINDFFRKKKDIDIFKKCHIVRFKRTTKYYAENSKKLYSDLENGYFTLKELAIFLLYKNLIGEKVNLYAIKPEHIIEVMKLFTTNKLKDDLKLLQAIYKELNFKGMVDFFDIKEDGTNIAYILTKQGKISPVFFIRNLTKDLTKYQENDIICVEFKQFIKIAMKIKETLERRFE